MDQNLYSRQIAAIGAETQKRLIKKRVFIQGLKGLGIEIAKNLILAGPGKVELYDTCPVQARDMGSNFYLSKDMVGKPRAENCIKELKNLNSYVDVTICTEKPTAAYLAQNFEVVCFTDCYERDFLIAVDQAVRNKKGSFIYTGNLGVAGFCFVDHGNDFSIFDKDGEEPKQCVIAGITQETEALVCTVEEKKHGLVDGDFVVFREVLGMTEINGKEFQVKVNSPCSFKIGDTTKFSPYERNGVIEQVKKTVEIKNRSLKESLDVPYGVGRKQFDVADWSKFGRSQQLHYLLKALFCFNSKNGANPKLLCKEDADQLEGIVKQLIEDAKPQADIQGSFKIEGIERDLIDKYCLYGRCQISPMASFWGGIAAQQIVKSTGKFSPLNQWLHHDFFEIIAEGPREVKECRYNDYELLFSNKYLDNAKKVKTFLVGAGALGCQYIKMFALMGIGTAGEVAVTDDDSIEVSNLNRQFLFRKENVGHNKCACATAAGKRMNPDSNFKAYQLRVDPQNDEVFNDEFWESRDFIVNAVDNVKARLFVDSQCVWYHRYLFESGTLGTKCNSQVIIPKHTQSYGDSQDPPEETIPLCTLKNFPYQIEHTIQWARDYFEGTFCEGPSQTQKFIEDPEGYLKKVTKELGQKPAMMRARLEAIDILATASQDRTYETCIKIARDCFDDVFDVQIAQLVSSFPKDYQTTEGKPFWSGVKRFPKAIKFDPADPIHAQFVQAAANIFAFVFGLPPEMNPSKVAEYASKLPGKPFVPKKIVIPDEKQKEAVPQATDQDEQVNTKLLQRLSKLTKLKPIKTVEFEKDDPTNFHIECVGGISNLRARNYDIGEVPNFKVKLIAGKIIPALATTTAMVVGAVGIEIVKKVLGMKETAFFNSYMNLALPLWVFSQPMLPIEHKDKAYDDVFLGPVKAIPPNFTNWDKFELKGPLTIEQMNKYFEEKHKISLSIVTVGKVCIYNKYDKTQGDKLGKTVEQSYKQLSGKTFPKHKRYIGIQANAEDSEGVDCLIPTIKYEIGK